MRADGPMTSRDCTDIYDRLGRVEATVSAQGERLSRVEGKVDRVDDKVDGLAESNARIEQKLESVVDRTADQEARMRRLQKWAWGLPSSVAAAVGAALAGWKL